QPQRAGPAVLAAVDREAGRVEPVLGDRAVLDRRVGVAGGGRVVAAVDGPLALAPRLAQPAQVEVVRPRGRRVADRRIERVLVVLVAVPADQRLELGAAAGKPRGP